MGLVKVLMIIGGFGSIFGAGIFGVLFLFSTKNRDGKIKNEYIWLELGKKTIMYGLSLALVLGISCAITVYDEQHFINIIKEKQEIVSKIQSGEYNDPLMQKTYVDRYNRKVEDTKIKSKSFMKKDFYSKDVDWQALEPLDLGTIQKLEK